MLKVLVLFGVFTISYGGFQVCSTVYDEQCWDEPRQQCDSVQKPHTTTVYEQECNTVQVPKVESVPEKSARTSLSRSATIGMRRFAILCMSKNAPLGTRRIAGQSTRMNVSMSRDLFRNTERNRNAILGMSRNVTLAMNRFATLSLRGNAHTSMDTRSVGMSPDRSVRAFPSKIADKNLFRIVRVSLFLTQIMYLNRFVTRFPTRCAVMCLDRNATLNTEEIAELSTSR